MIFARLMALRGVIGAGFLDGFGVAFGRRPGRAEVPRRRRQRHEDDDVIVIGVLVPGDVAERRADQIAVLGCCDQFPPLDDDGAGHGMTEMAFR